MTAIVGPSGAGKSTILSLIPRFWQADQGRITIGGADVTRFEEGALTDLVTVVFQEAWLFNGSIRDNIAAARPGASGTEIDEAVRAAQAHDFITSLPQGDETQVGEGGSALSRGDGARVAIACAILKDAPIILFDEATTALARLVAGRTLIMLAHKLSTNQAADQILVRDQGCIVERGQNADLLAKGGLYARFQAHRAKAARWQIGG